MTGRSTGQWIDDKTTTAKVKTAIAAAQIGSLTRVDVDTSNGIVCVTRVTANDAERQRIFDAARAAADGKPVTNNLVLVTGKRHEAATPAAMWPAASPRTLGQAETPPHLGQAYLASMATPPQTPLKFSRMVAEAPAYGRFAAYDQAGKHVATLYTLPRSELQFGLPTQMVEGCRSTLRQASGGGGERFRTFLPSAGAVGASAAVLPPDALAD